MYTYGLRTSLYSGNQQHCKAITFQWKKNKQAIQHLTKYLEIGSNPKIIWSQFFFGFFCDPCIPQA